MEVTLIGDFSAKRDEGLKNIAWNHYENLIDSNVNVKKIDISRSWKIFNLLKVLINRTDIVHYTPGPTNISILIYKFINISNLKTKLVIFTPHPTFSKKFFLKIKPKIDLALCQDIDTYLFFKDAKIQSIKYPLLINQKKFCPIGHNKKMELRKKYDVSLNDIVLLHVGHIKKNRNLTVLKQLSKKYHVLIIASDYIHVDNKLLNDLRLSGCDVRIGYEPNINEYYQLADIYLFPVEEGNTISTPLSVIEAISCNIPTIITKNKNILEFYKEDNIHLIESFENDLEKLIAEILSNKNKWKKPKVRQNIIQIYKKLILDDSNV